jgi:hypothetical protein
MYLRDDHVDKKRLKASRVRFRSDDFGHGGLKDAAASLYEKKVTETCYCISLRKSINIDYVSIHDFHLMDVK